MTAFFSDSITVNGIESFSTYYRVYNKALIHSRTPLVCVHGIRGSSADFEILASKITGRSTICIDVVGRGKSSWLQNWTLYNYNTYCRSCVALLRHLEVEKCCFLGTSMGGIVGMFLASRFPNLVENLILNDIGPYISRKPLASIVRYMLQTPTFDDLDSARKYLKGSLGAFGIYQEEYWDIVIKSHIAQRDGRLVLSGDPGIGMALQNEVRSIGHVMDLWDMWNKINCDVLILKGRYSNVLTHDIIQKMLAGRSNVELTVFEDAGHAPALFAEDRIVPIIDWIERSVVCTN